MEIDGIPTPSSAPPQGNELFPESSSIFNMGDIFWRTCLEVSPSIWLCLTSLRSSAMGRTVKCFQNMFWKEATRRRNNWPKRSPSPTVALLLFALMKWKPQTHQLKCGPHSMAWAEECHLEGRIQYYLGLSGVTVETEMATDMTVARGVARASVLITLVSAQLSQSHSCSLFTFLRKCPFSQEIAWTLSHGFLCVLLLLTSLISEFWIYPFSGPFSLATSWSILLEFTFCSDAICAWPISAKSQLQPWVSGSSSPPGLIPRPQASSRLCRVCV